ncbi:protein of unknown function [Thiomonas sp. CB2]|nr:protein of unknown function [Thiomonas sp. CB2]
MRPANRQHYFSMFGVMNRKTSNTHYPQEVNLHCVVHAIPDGHPNSPICGHLKLPHPGHGAMRC